MHDQEAILALGLSCSSSPRFRVCVCAQPFVQSCKRHLSETSVGYNVVLRELGVVLRVWLLDATAASLPVDLEAMEAFGSRGEEKKRNKTSVIMQFGGLAKTLGKSRNVEWEPPCTHDGRLYPQRLQARSL